MGNIAVFELEHLHPKRLTMNSCKPASHNLFSAAETSRHGGIIDFDTTCIRKDIHRYGANIDKVNVAADNCQGCRIYAEVCKLEAHRVLFTKMRRKVGCVISGSKNVSLTSKTIKGSSVISANFYDLSV
jgi:hypothetical protein